MMDWQNFIEMIMITTIVIGGLAFILGLYCAASFKEWLYQLRQPLLRPRYLKRIIPPNHLSRPNLSDNPHKNTSLD